MSPGYDRPNQQDFRRSIAFNCMFCHNAYPGSPPADEGIFPAELPEGIDCQRCHGPGSAHVEAASRKAPAEADSPRNRQSGAFVARAATRCVHAVSSGNHQPPAAQCRRALRTWAVRLPARPAAHRLLSVLRHAHPSSANDDNFEIAHAAYRLRKSKCFQASQMTCTTCHNPHDVPRGQDAAVRYNAACRKCHAAAHAAGVPGGGDCVSMPHAAPAHRRRRARGDDGPLHPAPQAGGRSSRRAGGNRRCGLPRRGRSPTIRRQAPTSCTRQSRRCATAPIWKAESRACARRSNA